MGMLIRDIYNFFSSRWTIAILLVITLFTLLLSLSTPEVLPPTIYFGGVWYTKFLWFLFGFSLLMLFIKRVLVFSENATKNGFKFAFSKAITSIPLAISLIGLIILLGLIQTFVPQHSFNRAVDLEARFGSENYSVMDSLLLFDIFDAWYLFAIVGLFVINLVACTVKRLKASVKYIHQEMTPKRIDSFERMPESHTLSLTMSTESALDRIKQTLKTKGFAVRSQDGQLLAERLRWERFSIDIFHIALIVTILALSVSGLYGFNTILVQYKGDTFAVPQRDFHVEVPEFGLDTYTDTERVMDWWTELNVVDNGEVVKQCKIEVNKPCYYQGMGIYQAAMGKDWLNTADLTFMVRKKDYTDNEMPILIGEYEVKVGESFSIPEENLLVHFDSFLPDFALLNSQIAYTKSQTPNNPAAYLEVTPIEGEDESKSFRTLTLKNAPILQASIPNQDYMFLITGMVAEEFTGLELSSDPGKGIAYLSFSMIILTLIGHLLLNHQMIWVVVDSETNRILIGGRARKGDFEDKFGVIIDSIERELGTKIEAPATGVTT